MENQMLHNLYNKDFKITVVVKILTKVLYPCHHVPARIGTFETQTLSNSSSGIQAFTITRPSISNTNSRGGLHQIPLGHSSLPQINEETTHTSHNHSNLIQCVKHIHKTHQTFCKFHCSKMPTSEKTPEGSQSNPLQLSKLPPIGTSRPLQDPKCTSFTLIRHSHLLQNGRFYPTM